MDLIENNFRDSSSIIVKTLDGEKPNLNKASEEIISALLNNKKLLICGNGGSAAESQHFAAELVGRFKINRGSLPALALTTDTSILSSIGNDLGFDKVFEKQVEAFGNEGDVLFALSTSGNSENVIQAINQAKTKCMKVISLTGNSGGKMKSLSDICLVVPSLDTARIQEAHLVIIHTLCEIIENRIFNKNG